MSISSISTNTPAYQPPQPNGARQNFQQLSQAVQSGDLASAQQAYAALTQNLPSQGANAGNGQFQQAIQSIGSALQSGNISGAQNALQALQTQMKGAHHGHHHHGQTQQADASQPSSTTSSTGISTLSATTPSVNLVA